MAQKEPLHIEIAAQVVARYYRVRKWMAYPTVGLPAAILLLFWLMLQKALALRSKGIWSSPPDFTRWWLGWGLAVVIMVPGILVAGWFKAGDWVHKKSDFWGMEEDETP